MGNATLNGLDLMDIHSDNDVGAIDLDNVLYRHHHHHHHHHQI